MEEVKIYSTPTCHFCQEAKEFLRKNDIPYTDYDVSKDTDRREEMLKLSGSMSVPVIVVGKDKMMVGFDEKNIKKMLDIEPEE